MTFSGTHSPFQTIILARYRLTWTGFTVSCWLEHSNVPINGVLVTIFDSFDQSEIIARGTLV